MRAATLLPCLALIAAQVCAAAPAAEASSELLTRHAGMSARRGDLVRRAASPPGGEVDYYNPLNRTGGSMLTVSCGWEGDQAMSTGQLALLGRDARRLKEAALCDERADCSG